MTNSTNTTKVPSALELLDFVTNNGIGAIPKSWELSSEILELIKSVKNAVRLQTSGVGNLLLACDSYKISHYKQYPPGTRYVYSYIESRGGKWNRTVFFGLQIFLKRYLSQRITFAMIDEAEAAWNAHGYKNFNRTGWEYIVREHKGKLPVSIKAVPEGTVVNGKNVLVSIVNTDPECYWLPSFLETNLLRAVWYPVTVATNSYECKQIIKEFLEATSDDPSQIMFKLHDFGARGVSSKESAEIGGAAHLVNFMGTDTMSGIQCVKEFYGVPTAGFSIDAAEHSTITSWGRENEAEAYRNMLKQFGMPGALVAVVSDSYNIYNAVANIWGKELREEVIASGACVVIRPDSGDPTVVPVKCIELLGEAFGYTVNSKGYKVLAPCVRVIQGDGININSIRQILQNLKDLGWAADNIAFGMGGKLLQADIDRDTLAFAMKCSAIDINGNWIDVFKQPIGDTGKHSKRGKLALVTEDGGETYKTVRADEVPEWRDRLIEVYHNGDLLVDHNFADIRKRAA